MIFVNITSIKKLMIILCIVFLFNQNKLYFFRVLKKFFAICESIVYKL